MVVVVVVVGGGGDHLNFAIPRRGQKNFTHTVGGSLKIYKT